jgi:ElaB/YqjD/DUF883 family membrane-anchored ribosome-binding protein
MRWRTAGRSLAIALFGLGGVLGAIVGRSAFWYGLTAVVVGLVMVPFESRAAPGTASPLSRSTDRDERLSGSGPPLAHLGGRVEEILRMAETTAEAKVVEARREAEAIVSAAHEQARAILTAAQSTATITAVQPTDTVPPTQPPPSAT